MPKDERQLENVASNSSAFNSLDWGEYVWEHCPLFLNGEHSSPSWLQAEGFTWCLMVWLDGFWVLGCWRGYLSGSRCRFACGQADATATHYSLSLAPVNPDWFYIPGFTFLVLAHLSSPGENPRGP